MADLGDRVLDGGQALEGRDDLVLLPKEVDQARTKLTEIQVSSFSLSHCEKRYYS